jgi:hypothetical protein
VDTFFAGDVWVVTTNVGQAKADIIQVKVDPKTGTIINCWHATSLKPSVPDEIWAYLDAMYLKATETEQSDFFQND